MNLRQMNIQLEHLGANRTRSPVVLHRVLDSNLNEELSFKCLTGKIEIEIIKTPYIGRNFT